MKWYRSYAHDLQTTLDSGRAIVYDPNHCEPFYARQYSYWPLFEQVTENFCLIEWDMAISLEDRQLFEKYCREQPDRVHVAPYRSYAYRNSYQIYEYMHRTSHKFFVEEGEPYCFYFGFGLIYLPLAMVKDYMADCEAERVVETDWQVPFKLYPGPMRGGATNDCSFSYWHATSTNMEPVPVHWDVRPVHLHYDVKSAIGETEKMREQL
jgi:hypothetical protein